MVFDVDFSSPDTQPKVAAVDDVFRQYADADPIRALSDHYLQIELHVPFAPGADKALVY